MQNIVTGGCGFIGSHLTDALIARGETVTVVDNCSIGNMQNLAHHKGNSNLEIIVDDIANRSLMQSLINAETKVFHLAALADIVPSVQDPQKYFHSNVDGTLSVLEACRQNGVKRVTYVASSSCYGLADTFPTPESAPIKPMYPYALTKYLGEEMVMHWSNLYKFPALSLRFFNIYGPKARTSGTYGAVFGVFLAQLNARKPLTIVGDGTQTRDFTYVSDAVSALLAASDSDVTGECFNVGSDKPVSINRLVELLGAKETVFIPKRPGEPDCTFADTSKIKAMLNWSSKVSFEEGVNNMLSHIDNWKDAPVWTPSSIQTATEDWFKYLG